MISTSRFQAILSDLQRKEEKLREAGQKEYAQDESNVMANFERVEAYLDIPREKVLMVYLLKHIDGITSHLNGHESQREPVQGRVQDARVYLGLLYAMLEDNDEKKKERNIKISSPQLEPDVALIVGTRLSQ